ncbi:FliG C-terminal domain-containing protein [Buchnera aphidicola]|uniref:FliG C-terminal domain-containing protein n=1 Tax=Buchnera aphidicola TaxID=9 RepID=UPI0034644DCF
MSLNGIERSSILLMSIDVDSAVKVLKKLTILESRKILKCMVNINNISSVEVNKVLKECVDFILPNNYFSYVYGDYLFSILKKTLGEKEATIFLEENVSVKNMDYIFEKLKNINPKQLFDLIKNEHIQIITAILVYVKDYQAAEVLDLFNEKKRSQILLRIATFSGLNQSGKKELVNIVTDILSRYEYMINNQRSLKKVAKILTLMKNHKKKSIIHDLSNFNIDMTKKILNEIFSFKNLVNMQDKYICDLVNHVDLDTICIGLSHTDDLLKNKFIKNMSEQDASYLRGQLSKKSTLLTSDITNAQKLILKTMRSFLEKEEITIKENKVE